MKKIFWAHMGWFLWHISVIRVICSQSLCLFPNYLSGLYKQGEDERRVSEFINLSKSCKSARRTISQLNLLARGQQYELRPRAKWNLYLIILCCLSCVDVFTSLYFIWVLTGRAENTTRLEDACKGKRRLPTHLRWASNVKKNKWKYGPHTMGGEMQNTGNCSNEVLTRSSSVLIQKQCLIRKHSCNPACLFIQRTRRVGWIYIWCNSNPKLMKLVWIVCLLGRWIVCSGGSHRTGKWDN